MRLYAKLFVIVTLAAAAFVLTGPGQAHSRILHVSSTPGAEAEMSRPQVRQMWEAAGYGEDYTATLVRQYNERP